MNRNTKKKDVSEKVREIRQRQENWLKQREESQNQGKSSPSKSVASHSTQPAKETVRDASPVENLSQVLASSKSKVRFKNWMKAKQTEESGSSEYDSPSLRTDGAAAGRLANGKDGRYDARNYSEYGDNSYSDAPYRDHRGSQEVNILRVPSTRPTEHATPEPGWNSDDETGEITAAQLLSPEDFDSVADNIIARVKGDLLLDKNKDIGHGRNQHDPRNAGRTVVSTGNNAPTAELSSHFCPACEKLMVPPLCSPLLLIPCGHTLCKGCRQLVKRCDQCGCPIQSSTANLMLQQIITNFQDKQAHSKITAAMGGATVGGQPTSGSGTKFKTKNRYREEYQNLKTRQEILHGECESISKNIQRLQRKLAQEHSQVEHVLQEEKKLEMKIASLQQNLRDLVEQRVGYEQSCEQIQSQTKQEKNKLALAKDTIVSLQREMEKVKLLAEDD